MTRPILTAAYFQDETAAFAFIETQVWSIRVHLPVLWRKDGSLSQAGGQDHSAGAFEVLRLHEAVQREGPRRNGVQQHSGAYLVTDYTHALQQKNKLSSVTNGTEL